MKKGIKTLVAAALAVSALTPVAAAAATPTSTNVEAGVYTATNFYSLTDFAKLSTADKVAVLTAEGTVVVVAGQVYTANDVLTASDSELEALGTSVDEYTTEDGNKIESGKPLDQTGEVIDPVVELTVESVSAINANYVTVTITASEEDLLAQTVEVKNAAGTVVEVKPLDIAAGDTTADFEFVTAQKADDLKGIWTVAGQSYDLDLFNKLADFLNAATQVELKDALTALEISNVEVANLPEYLLAQGELEVEATELTVADVQKLVDDVNAKNLSASEEETLVKAIVKAVTAGNDVLTLSALEDAGVSPLNSEWAGDYVTALAGITDATPLKDVQAAINDENDAQVQAEITTTGVDKAKLTASQALITAYATVTETGAYKVAAITTAVEDIKEQIALAEVLEATTPTAFKNKLTALATLVDDTAVLDMADYVDANGKAYIAALKAETVVTNKDTVSLVEAILFSGATSVNATEAASLVTAVTDAATAIETAETATPGSTTAAQKTALIKALNNLGVKQVTDANIAEYVKVATSLKAVADLAGAQTQVDTANLAAVTAADKTTIIAKLNVFGIDNVVAANAEAYVADIVVPAAGADNKATVADVKAAVKVVNDQVAETAAVTAINKATTAAEVKTALDTLAISDYLNVTSADRIFIAEQVLDARDKVTTPVAKEFADKAAVTTAVQTAATARTNAISGVNTLVIADDLTAIADALLAVGHSSLTGVVGTPTANDTAIADAFITSVAFDTTGAITPQYRSIAEIRAALSGL